MSDSHMRTGFLRGSAVCAFIAVPLYIWLRSSGDEGQSLPLSRVESPGPVIDTSIAPRSTSSSVAKIAERARAKVSGQGEPVGLTGRLRVMDDKDEPLAGACLASEADTASRSAQPLSDIVVSGSDGCLEITRDQLLSDSHAALVVTCPGFVPYSLSSEDVARLVSGTDVDIQLQSGVTLRIWCGEESGSNLAGVRVAVSKHRLGFTWSSSPSSVVGAGVAALSSAVSDADGWLTLSGLEPGLSYVGVQHDECVYMGGGPLGERWLITESAEYRLYFRRLVVAAAVGAEGRVLGSTCLMPVTGYDRSVPWRQLNIAYVRSRLRERLQSRAALFVGLPDTPNARSFEPVRCIMAMEGRGWVEIELTPQPLVVGKIQPVAIEDTYGVPMSRALRVNLTGDHGQRLPGIPIEVVGRILTFEGVSGEVIRVPMGELTYRAGLLAQSVGSQLGDQKIVIEEATPVNEVLSVHHTIEGSYEGIVVRPVAPYEEDGMRCNLRWRDGNGGFYVLNQLVGSRIELWVRLPGGIASADAFGLRSEDIDMVSGVDIVDLPMSIR